MSDTGLSLAEIAETRALIAPYIVRTPVFPWRGREITSIIGPETELFLKFELFQHSGSFKARGALSQMLRLSPEALKRGVTAVSSGNHAIAVAYVASVLGVDAKVVMIKTANPAKRAAARAYGAEILLAEDGPAGFAMADALVAREGRTLVHPFEGRNVSLGTATAGLEFLEDAGPLDAMIIAVGGGGLISGSSAVAKLLQPSCRVFGVEPSGAAVMHKSFEAGSAQRLASIATIADSLAPPMTLPYVYGLCRANVDELVMVEDDALRSAMALLFRELKLAVEPACAAAVAALTGPLRDRLRGKRVGVVLCGSNIDADSFANYVRDRMN